MSDHFISLSASWINFRIRDPCLFDWKFVPVVHADVCKEYVSCLPFGMYSVQLTRKQMYLSKAIIMLLSLRRAPAICDFGEG